MDYFDVRQYLINIPVPLVFISVKSGKIVYSNKTAERTGLFAGISFTDMLADKNDFLLLAEAGTKPAETELDLKIDGEPFRARLSVYGTRFSGMQSVMAFILEMRESRTQAAEKILPAICDIFTGAQPLKKERAFLQVTAESFGAFCASLYEKRQERFKLKEEWRARKSVVVPILCPGFEDKAEYETKRIKSLKRAADILSVPYRKAHGTEGIIMYCFDRQADESAAVNARRYAQTYAALSPDEPRDDDMRKAGAALFSASRAIAVWNRDTMEIIYDNKAFRELFGFICERRMTKNIGAGVSAAKDAREEYCAPDGRIFEVSHSLSRICGENMVATLFSDITEYKRAQTKLDMMANIDALTGLLNRRAGTEKLEAVYRQCRKEKKPLTVCFADIDGLKAINDTYGHGAGDAMIRSVADVLKKYVNGSGFSCRLGGDEFVLILPGIKREQASVIAAQIERETRNCLAGESQGISMSFGFKEAEYGQTETAQTLISVADSDMYSEKRRRRSGA